MLAIKTIAFRVRRVRGSVPRALFCMSWISAALFWTAACIASPLNFLERKALLTLAMFLSCANVAFSLPDLIVEDIGSSPSPLIQGENASYHVIVRNVGVNEDGQPNLAEWIAGSDPKSRSSRFGFSGMGAVSNGSGIRIEWPTLPGRLYTLYRAEVLDAEFLPIAPNLSHEQNHYDDQTAGDAAFYRVQVKLEAP